MSAVSNLEITTETEDGTGWVFRVQAIADDGALVASDLRLSWSDYDFWCPGAAWPPATVALAVAAFVVDREGVAGLRPRFDAASVRRRHAEADAVIPTLVGRGEPGLGG